MLEWIIDLSGYISGYYYESSNAEIPNSDGYSVGRWYAIEETGIWEDLFDLTVGNTVPYDCSMGECVLSIHNEL